jgi:hypothetical protein
MENQGAKDAENPMRSIACSPVFSGISSLLTILALVTNAQSQFSGLINSMKKMEPSAEVPDPFKFEPEWREKGDCGPMALYFLMRLNNRQVTIAEVKKATPFDPEVGCSLADLVRAGDLLGFPAEIRFVRPSDLNKLPFPYIVHTEGSLQRRTGHFDVIVSYSSEERKYEVLNVSFERVDRVPEESILRIYTGYVLLPKRPFGSPSWRVLSFTMISVGCVFAAVALFRPSFFWKKRSARPVPLANQKP